MPFPSRSDSLFLKSLEIAGFKSFARPVRLEFPRGITAFVGPNGSGKSNVVDAVRWCLGEQSVRDLRAQRTEDVIYAGPRKVLGAAEVTLTFESDGDDEMPWTELAVGRRLYRSGESEYLVNGQRARLRDLTSSLRLLGIDSGRNVVVTQGMADALLSASPGERRGLLEQAAGLGPYRERRDEARQKLATTTHNIETIEAVLAEMEPRLRLLRRQARAVQDRDEARRMLRARSAEWFAYRWQESGRRVTEVQGEAHAAAQQRATRTAELRAMEQEADRVLECERRLRRDMEEAVNALHAAERQRDSAQHGMRRIEHARAESEEKLRAAQVRMAALAPLRADTGGRIATVQQTLDEMDCRRDELRVAEQRAENAWQRARDESHVLEARLQAAHATRQKSQGRRAAVVERLRNVRITLEDQQQRASNIDRRLVEARESLRQAEDNISRMESDMAGAEALLHASRDAAGVAQSELDAAQRRHERIRKLERRVHQACSDVTIVVTSLTRALQSLDREAPGLLAGLQSVAGWDDAIAAAVRDWAFAGDAGTSRMRSGPTAEFLRWRSTLGDLPDGCWWADTVVSGLRPDLLHPLLLTVLADTDHAAKSAWFHLAGKPAYLLGWPGLMVVSRDGMVHEASGVRQARGDERTARYLRTTRELATAKQRVSCLQARQARVAAACDEAARKLHVCEERREQRTRALTAAKRDMAERAERRARLERSRAMAEAERGESSRQLEIVRKALESGMTEEGSLRTDLERLNHDLQTSTRAWQEAQDEARASGTAVSEAAAHHLSVRQAAKTLAAEHRAQAEVLLHGQRELQRLDDEVAALTGAQTSLGEEIERLGIAIGQQSRPLSDLQALAAEQRVRLETLRQREPNSATQLDIRRARETLTSAIARHERALAALAHVQEEHHVLTDELARDLECDPAQLPAPPDVPPTQDEIRRLRARAAQYADADPSVIEESHDLAQRQAHLQANLEDLRRAVETLREMMTAADVEMRVRFDRAFAAVNDEFSRVFRVMLRGGDATLQRSEDDGIEVHARLPSRRVRSSAAFSGGERALVASALLFGVLKIRPAPFCLLDEVDAALDESNVDRYLAVLRDIGQQTQIMVVTHNRATMAAADVLYGLTMSDEGISSALSLRLDSYVSA